MKRFLVPTLLVLLMGASANAADEKKEPRQKDMHSKKADLDYLLYLPPSYKRNEEPVPMILFLHGAGERGNDLKQVKKHGPPKLVEKGKDFPFVIVSPQCPRSGWWDVKKLTALLDEVVANYRIDKNRIYVTGLSMGGFGTWALSAEHPDRFAAIAPICGGGNPKTAEKLKNMPIWVFHGAKDRAVPLDRSKVMVEAVKKAGNKNVKLKIYPEAGHDSWTVSYNNPELYKWFLMHTRKK